MSGTKKGSQAELDENGNPKVDEAGNIVYQAVDVPADFGSQNVTFTKAE